MSDLEKIDDEELAELLKSTVAKLRARPHRWEIPFAIVAFIGLISLLGGIGRIFIDGIDLLNGSLTLFGGVISYFWHQSDLENKHKMELIELIGREKERRRSIRLSLKK